MQENHGVACFLFDHRIGGPTVRVKAVYRHLSRVEPYQVTAVFLEQGPGSRFLENAGLNTAIVPAMKPTSPRNFLAFAKYFMCLPMGLLTTRRFLKQQRIGLVHVNGVYDLIPAIAGRLAGCKVLWHLNDAVFSPRVSRILGRIVQGLSHKVAVSSFFVADHFGLDREAVTRLFVPVDLERFPKRHAKFLAVTNRPVSLAHLANWNPLKGQDDLVTVLEHLVESKVPFQARFLGGLLETQQAYWQPLKERLSQPPLSKQVTIEGFVDDIPTALADIDLLIITSRSESGPISCIEAMAAGTPVISYPVGDVPIMIGADSDTPAGILVPQGDTDALKRAITELISDPKRYQSYSANAIKRAETNYSARRAADLHDQLYRSMLNIG